METSFIVYACPTGPLADQAEAFFARSLAECGRNAAHDYMPHCSLTGFFRDRSGAADLYAECLGRSLLDGMDTPPPAPAVKGMTCSETFIGLELESEELKRRVARFAGSACSPTRSGEIRLKDWLHLSLAYRFPPGQFERLAGLAREMADPAAPAVWEARLYERAPDGSWRLHYARALVPVSQITPRPDSNRRETAV